VSSLSFQSAPRKLQASQKGTDFRGMLFREFVILTRNRLNFVLSLLPTLIYLLLLNTSLANLMGSIPYKGTEIGYDVFLLPMVLMAAVLSASAMASSAMFQEEMSGISTELWSYPLRRSRYLVGKMLVGVTLVVLQTVLALVLAIVVFQYRMPWDHWLTLGVAVIATALAFSALYLVVALSIREFQLFNVITSASIPILLFGSPSLYSVEHMPVVLRWFSTVNPATYGITSLRDGLIFGPGTAWRPMIVLFALAFVSYAVASWALLRRASKV
jgi:ABC-2 type transport system permease protein